jgi:hypothetical protein
MHWPLFSVPSPIVKRGWGVGEETAGYGMGTVPATGSSRNVWNAYRYIDTNKIHTHPCYLDQDNHSGKQVRLPIATTGGAAATNMNNDSSSSQEDELGSVGSVVLVPLRNPLREVQWLQDCWNSFLRRLGGRSRTVVEIQLHLAHWTPLLRPPLRKG